MFPPETSNEKIKTWVLLQLLSQLFSAFCFRKLSWLLDCFLVTAIVILRFLPGFSFNARNILQSDEARGKYNISRCFFSHSLPNFGSEGMSCIPHHYHLPAEVEKCIYCQRTNLNQWSIEKEIFKKQFSISWYDLTIDPEPVYHKRKKPWKWKNLWKYKNL